MKEPEMAKVAAWFSRVAENVTNETELAAIAAEVRELCAAFPCPGIAR
jgi:glycine/serine hydroxymethyltransferase